MVKVLVNLSINKGVSQSAMVIDVPNTYRPTADIPDSGSPFPQLREWIYEAVKEKSLTEFTIDEVEAYNPDNTFVSGISIIGRVAADTGKITGDIIADYVLCSDRL